VTRHADVRRCLLDDAALSNRSNFYLGDIERFAEPTNITMMDPPRHTGLRKAELGGFSRGPIRVAAPWIGDIATRLLDEFVDDRHADLSAQFGLRLTTQVIARLVGVPTSDAEQVVSWAHDITQVRPDPVEQLPSFTSLFGYLSSLVTDRRASSSRPDDMITRLIDWSDAIGEDPAGLPTHVYQLMAAGFPTTAYTFELAMYELLHRGLWGAVVAGTAPVASVRDEALRHGSAIRAVFRLAVEDLVVGETEIPAGSRVVLSLESANRDEAVFDDADEFLIGRGNSAAHLAFGAGIHLCLGAPLARLELDTVLELLARRLPTLRLANGFVPRRRPVRILNGLETLPVEW
jgi:cytochrome P450